MEIVIHQNIDTLEYFFSTDHCQGEKSRRGAALYPQGEGWVPVTHYFPSAVAPRPTLPSGVIETVADIITVYYFDYTEIPNPDPNYQPAPFYTMEEIAADVDALDPA